jgi:hypothetical protein
LSSDSAYPDNVYVTLYNRKYDSLANLALIKNTEIELYCEVHVMIVHWVTSSNDGKTQSELNENENGTIQVQERAVETINYEKPIGTPQTKDYIGVEDEIKATVLLDEKYMLNIMNLQKNHKNYYKESPVGTLQEKVIQLGIFNGESNPYGVIKIENCKAKTTALYNSFKPNDIPNVKYQDPLIVSWETGAEPDIITHENGDDTYSFSGSGQTEIRTQCRWFQKVNGDMIPVDDFVYDNQDYAFDFSV